MNSRFDADTLARAIEFAATGGKHTPVVPTEAPAMPMAPAVPAVTQSQPSDDSPDAVTIAAKLARRFEGLYLRPYLCPAGIPTIGYGATYYEDGRRVMLTDPPITRERADALLLWMVKIVYLPAVIGLCEGADTPSRVAMLIDFAFNLGNSRLKTSTLRRKVNAGQWGAVPIEVMKWNKAGGRVLAGLTRRCLARVKLI